MRIKSIENHIKRNDKKLITVAKANETAKLANSKNYSILYKIFIRNETNKTKSLKKKIKSHKNRLNQAIAKKADPEKIKKLKWKLNQISIATKFSDDKLEELKKNLSDNANKQKIITQRKNMKVVKAEKILITKKMVNLKTKANELIDSIKKGEAQKSPVKKRKIKKAIQLNKKLKFLEKKVRKADKLVKKAVAKT